MNLARELGKQRNMKVVMIPIVIGAIGTVLQRLGKDTGRVGNRSTKRDYTDCSVVEIGKNIEKYPGYLRIHVVFQYFSTWEYRKQKLQVQWNIENQHNQTIEDERKNNNRMPQTSEETSQNQALQ